MGSDPALADVGTSQQPCPGDHAPSKGGQQRLGPRFDEALLFASGLHRQQVRKGTGGTPYISHLLAVCALVLENGADEDEVIAALLHDAAEDQGGEATVVEIASRFGKRVASIVSGCSDTLERPKPPAHQRKEAYLARLDDAGTPRSVLLVAAADRLHNLRSTLADHRSAGELLWERFKLSPAEQFWYHQSASDIFDRRLGGQLAEELKRLLPELAAATGGGSQLR